MQTVSQSSRRLETGLDALAKARNITDLDCDSPAAEEIPLILHTRVVEMCALRERALDWSDTEGVHDMRVASRRLRGAIADLKPYLRRNLPRGRLRAIARSLGAVRDQDVALPALEELRAKAGGNVAKGIESIIDERRRQRLKARAALEQAIAPEVIAELRDDLVKRLQIAPRPPKQTGPTFRQVAIEVIGTRLKQLTAGAECIYHPQMMKELHEMRILAKRLRYAVELFATCWGEDLRQAAKEIARLQTSLGELHDCDIWIADFGGRLRKSSRAKIPSAKHRHESEAAVWLLRHFAKERTNHYRDALARWYTWQTDNFLSDFKTLVQSDSSLPAVSAKLRRSP